MATHMNLVAVKYIASVLEEQTHGVLTKLRKQDSERSESLKQLKLIGDHLHTINLICKAYDDNGLLYMADKVFQKLQDTSRLIQIQEEAYSESRPGV